jgi:hypothetical protein
VNARSIILDLLTSGMDVSLTDDKARIVVLNASLLTQNQRTAIVENKAELIACLREFEQLTEKALSNARKTAA